MSIKCSLLWFLKWFSIEQGKYSQAAVFLVRFRELIVVTLQEAMRHVICE